MSRWQQALWTALLALTLASWPLAAEAGPAEAPLHGSGPIELDERASDPEVEERQRGKAQTQDGVLEDPPATQGFGPGGCRHPVHATRLSSLHGTLPHGLRAPPA
ncbi:hypothetical protein ABI59_19865 [Acidobacteria bacterium Mor1]|nr:hypothetical protein ABI59_19865 [Acidobacteria bacterium Mor1]